MFAPDLHLLFTGDTGYSKDFKDIRQRFAARQTTAAGGGFDIALIALGACEPRWFMACQHIDLAEAVQVHLDLNAKRSLGVRWGTFQSTDESPEQPLIDLVEVRRSKGVAEADFFVMAIGETRQFARRGASSDITAAPGSEPRAL